MGSRCSVSFTVQFALGSDATIAFGSVSVSLLPGTVSKWKWVLHFTYTPGDPPATAFRLNSADGLVGGFTPKVPKSSGNPSEIFNAVCQGIVTHTATVDVTYDGTVTIIQ